MRRNAFILLAAVTAAPTRAQDVVPPAPLLVAAAGDSVRLLLTVEPPPFGGFHVYRALAGGAAERMTTEPVRRVADPRLAAALLGADVPLLMRALEAEDESDLLRRLRRDAFAAHVFALVLPQAAHVLGRQYVDRAVSAGATYEYRIAFTDGRGAETGESHSARVIVRDVSPAPPGELVAQPEDASVQLSWRYRPYVGDPDDPVIGFHVYRARADAGEPVRLTRTPLLRNQHPTAEFRDTAVTAGVEYRYSVRAIDLAGSEGLPSPGVVATPVDRTPPATPAGLSAEPGDGRVQLEWLYSTEPDVAGYHVERGPGLDQPFARLTTTPLPSRTPFFLDTTAAGGTQYFYRIVAVDGSGNESRPGSALSVLPYDRTAPAPPGAVQVEVADRRLVIRWRASPSADVRGYYVYRGGGAERLVRLVEQPVQGTEFIDAGYGGAGLAPGEPYDVRVSAVDNSYNESEPAAASAVVPDDELPAPPTAFAARNHLGRWIELTWSPSASLDVSEYELSRMAANGAPTIVQRVAADMPRAVRDSTLEAGRTYTYTLIAIDSAGNRGEAATASAALHAITAPPPPRFAAARVRTTGIEIWWERVVSAELEGYHVYRSRLPTGAAERVTRAPVDALTFTDPSGSADWFYTVRAVDRSGNESDASPAARPVR